MSVSTRAAVLACVLFWSAAPGLEAQQPAPPPPAPPPQAPAALSVPNPLAGFRPGPRDLYQSPDGSDRYQHRAPHPVPDRGPVIVFPWAYAPGPYYAYGTMFDATSQPRVEHERRFVAPRGALVLLGVPDSVQVYVDGYYVGIAGEFGALGRPMDIAAGRHHVELRAAGYETLSFAVMIEPNGILRYRGEMARVSSTPLGVLVPQPTQAAKSVYVIPKCYAGDKPPANPLPAGCDPKKMTRR